MKNTKRALSFTLSIIMVLTMVLGSVVMPAGAALVDVGTNGDGNFNLGSKSFTPEGGNGRFKIEMAGITFGAWDDGGVDTMANGISFGSSSVRPNNTAGRNGICLTTSDVSAGLTASFSIIDGAKAAAGTSEADGRTASASGYTVENNATNGKTYELVIYGDFNTDVTTAIYIREETLPASDFTLLFADIPMYQNFAANTGYYPDADGIRWLARGGAGTFNWASFTIADMAFKTIKVDANSTTATGDAPDTEFLLVSATYTVPANPFADAGFTFKEWNTEPDGSGTSYDPADDFAVSADVTLYAIWEGAGAGIPQTGKITLVDPAVAPGASKKVIAEFDVTFTAGADNIIGFNATEYKGMGNPDNEVNCAMFRLRYNASSAPSALYVPNGGTKNGGTLAGYNEEIDTYLTQSVKVIFDFDTQTYTVYMKSTADSSAEYEAIVEDYAFWVSSASFDIAKMIDIAVIYTNSAPVNFTNMVVRQYNPVEVTFMDSDGITVMHTFADETTPYDIVVPDDTGLTVPAGSGAFKGWVLDTDSGDESTLVEAGDPLTVSAAAVYVPVWEASTANNPPEALATLPVMYVEVGDTVSFTADDIATDADDDDTLEITDIVTPPGGTNASATLSAGVIEISGLAVGTDSIEVEVSDGTDVVNITVSISVETLYTISGTITYDSMASTIVQTVSYVVDGGAVKTVDTDAAGAYTIAGIPDTAVVDISVEDVVGYVTPADVQVTIAAIDATGADFDYVTETFDITGTVSGLADVENVSVYYSTTGALDILTDTSVLTDASGAYSITVNYGTALTIYVDDEAGFVTPDAIVIASVEADTADQDFEYIATYTVSGTITEDGAAFVGDIEYSIDDGTAVSITVAADGSYAVADIVEGSKFEITDIGGYDLTKYVVTGDLVIAAVTADVTGFDVDVAEILGYTISGTIMADAVAYEGDLDYAIDGTDYTITIAAADAGAYSIFVPVGSDLVITVPVQFDCADTLTFDDVAADNSAADLTFTTKTFKITVTAIEGATITHTQDSVVDTVVVGDTGVVEITGIKYGTAVEIGASNVTGYLAPETTDTYDFTSLEADAAITYTYAPITYTISWVDDSGANPTIADDTVVYGGVAVSKDISRSGYALNGWYTEATLVTKWDFDTVVTSDMTFYAKWDRRSTSNNNPVTPWVETGSFAVSFNTQGGSTVASITVVKDGTVTKPADPTKEGYVFDGWYKDAACTIAWDFAADKITNTTTIYAKWTEAGVDGPEGPETPDIVNPEASYEIKENAASISFVQGRPDKTFGPDARVTRAEAVTMLYRLMNFEGLDGRASFSDDNMWAQEAIRAFAEAGIVNGISATQFAPDSNITRGQFATIIARLMGLDVDAAAGTATDIAGHWAAANIAAVIDAGYMSGYNDGSFKPDQAMTRAEMVVTINRMLGVEVPAYGADANEFTDISPDHWAYNDICKATGK